MLRYALLTAALLGAIPCSAQTAPAVFAAPGVREMGEAQAKLCRAYMLEVGVKRADSEAVWARLTRGMSVQQQKLTAMNCVIYSAAWQDGGTDIVSSGVAKRTK